MADSVVAKDRNVLVRIWVQLSTKVSRETILDIEYAEATLRLKAECLWGSRSTNNVGSFDFGLPEASYHGA
jgi:hypothetical protein